MASNKLETDGRPKFSGPVWPADTGITPLSLLSLPPPLSRRICVMPKMNAGSWHDPEQSEQNTSFEDSHCEFKTHVYMALFEETGLSLSMIRDFYCRFVIWVSIYNLICIAMERHTALVYPIFYKKTTKKHIAFVFGIIYVFCGISILPEAQFVK